MNLTEYQKFLRKLNTLDLQVLAEKPNLPKNRLQAVQAELKRRKATKESDRPKPWIIYND